MNQCDGCQRGLPVEGNGMHRPEGGWPFVCTAGRYALPEKCPTYKTTSEDHTICQRCKEMWPTGRERACVKAQRVLSLAIGVSEFLESKTPDAVEPAETLNSETKSRWERMQDKGYTRRPSWRSLPSDDDEPSGASGQKEL